MSRTLRKTIVITGCIAFTLPATAQEPTDSLILDMHMGDDALDYSGNGNNCILFRADETDVSNTAGCNFTWNFDQWYQVGLTYSQAQGVANFYVDGVNVCPRPTPPTSTRRTPPPPSMWAAAWLAPMNTPTA